MSTTVQWGRNSMIRLTIDGQEITVPEGTMIVDAAARLGIEVPVYCYHPALGPLGACRMCLVQVEKMPKLATGCTTPVTEGMVVHTKGPAVDKGRKGVLEFLLINHPLDCPVCDKGGECFLQDYTFRYGPPVGRFEEPKIEKLKDAPINEFILIDQERCVLCQRCVRFMGEYVGEEQLLLEGRGVETVIATVDHRPVTSPFSGNVIDLCPVGALLSRPYRYKARPWNIEKEESVCPHCPVGCTQWVTGRENRVVRTEGRAVPDREWGWLCDRGRFGYDFGYVAGRLTSSILEGQSTAAALATRKVGQWLDETLNQYGPDGVGMIIGGIHTTEEAYQLKTFAQEAIGTRHLAISRSVAGYLPRGLNGTFEDLGQADQVVLLGVDPYDAVPVVHLKLRESRRKTPGLEIRGVAPRRLSKETLPVKDLVVAPGEDAAVMALALAQVAGDHPAVMSLIADLKDFRPKDVDERELQELGGALLRSRHLVLLWDGENRDMEAVLTALAAVREAPTRVLPTFGPANWRGFERAGFPADFGALKGILEAARDGQIHLLFLWGADILRDFPDYDLARQALEKVDRVVAAAITPPLGAELVDALLPVAAWGEVYGTYVNMEARLQVANPSVNPPGQARPTKAYLTAWARGLKKSFLPDDEWDPYDDGSGDLIADEPVPAFGRAVGRPPETSEGPWLITGDWVMEGGLPSDFLRPRVPQWPGEVNPDDARQWGISDQGGSIRLSRGERRLDIRVRPSPRIPRGRIYLPRGVPEMGVNRLGPGPVTVTRLEEVSVG